MYRKETDNGTIRFFYNKETLFNDVSLMSNFMAKNLATKEGNSLTDEFAMSDDERDLFGVCVQQCLPDIYESMAKITHGVNDAFDALYTEDMATQVRVYAGSPYPEHCHLQYNGGGEDPLNLYIVPGDGAKIGLRQEEATGTASVVTTAYTVASYDLVSITIQDNEAYNENVLSLVDASLYNALKQGVLKEFYSVIVQPDFFKTAGARFLEELFKLKQRLFQLKKKSVVSSLT